MLISTIVLVLALMAWLSFDRGDAIEAPPVQSIGIVRQSIDATSPHFRARVESGADCSELWSIRDTFDPTSATVAEMNRELGAIGCETPFSARVH